MVLKEALKEHFSLFGVNVDNDDILAKCLDLCDIHNLDEESFVETWMAFSVSHCQGDNPTVEYLCQMERKELKKDAVLSNSATNFVKNDNNLSKIAVYNSHTMKQNNDNEDILELYGCKTPTTPKTKRLRSPEGELDTITDVKIRAVESPFSPSSYSPKTATPSRFSSNVANRGKILFKYGGDTSSWKNEDDKRVVKVCKSSEHNHVPSKALYMYEKLINKANALDSVCEELGTSMCKITNDMDKVELDAVGSYSRSQYQIQTYGRICCDSDGKLNTASILLEGSKILSSGVRVKLDLGKLNHYSIFPGQIVSVKGVNPTGNSLVVKNLYFESPPPPPDNYFNSKSIVEDNDKDLSNISVVFAAGPFTQADDLKYEPLMDLIDYVEDNKPHVFILVGPFVDFEHTEISKCEMAESFDDFFEQFVSNIMGRLKNTSTQVVMVSSHRDVHHAPVYPTPQFRLKQTYQNLHFMPDPCMIDIEGIVVATTSVDSLMHLGREEISFNATSMDRLTRLATHVLAQRCFYPLVPPSEGINVDTDLWEKYAFMDKQPHVLILPSSLRYFCKKIYQTVVINPERLSKRSFARFKINLNPSSKDGWKIADNLNVEILKV